MYTVLITWLIQVTVFEIQHHIRNHQTIFFSIGELKVDIMSHRNFMSELKISQKMKNQQNVTIIFSGEEIQ